MLDQETTFKFTPKQLLVALIVAIGSFYFELILEVVTEYFFDEDCELTQIQIIDITFTNQDGFLISESDSILIQSNTGEQELISEGKVQIKLSNHNSKSSKYDIKISNESESIIETVDLEKCENKGTCSLCHYPDAIVIANKLLRKSKPESERTEPIDQKEKETSIVSNKASDTSSKSTKPRSPKKKGTSSNIKEIQSKEIEVSSITLPKKLKDIDSMTELEKFANSEFDRIRNDENKRTIARILAKFQVYKSNYDSGSWTFDETKKRFEDFATPLLELIEKNSNRND